MDPVRMDLVWRRNAPEPEAFALTDVDPTTGATTPVDLTGTTMRLQLRMYPGAAGAPLATLGMAAPGQPGIGYDDAGNGQFTITPPASLALLALPVGADPAGAPAELAYDLVLIHGDGLVEALFEGAVRLPMGVTI